MTFDSKTLAFAVALLAAGAFAQGVKVETSDGKTVEVGSGAGVEVKTGKGTVKVGAGGVEVKKKGHTVTADTGDDDDDDDAAGEWRVTGQGTSQTHACTPGQEVEISGQGHAITLTGPCGEVEVSGQSNQVTVDVAQAIKVSGIRNTVSWRSGPDGKKPKVKKSGVNNKVTQLKSP